MPLPLPYLKTGTGRPVILVPGNGGSHRIFWEGISLLRRYVTVYAPDLPRYTTKNAAQPLRYETLAEDVFAWIRQLSIEKPVFYGFSDGGIIGLILAEAHPNLFSSLIVSGVNLDPHGLRPLVRWGLTLKYRMTKAEPVKMMLNGPHIPLESLAQITVPTYLTAGQFDCIRPEHTKRIAAHIPHSSLHIMNCHLHGSYVVHSRKFARYILSVIKDTT